MSRWFSSLLVFTVAGLLASCRSAQPHDSSLDVMNDRDEVRRPLLPETFGAGWTRVAPPRVFVGDDLFNHINGAAELFTELGFGRVQVARYERAGVHLGLELYEMQSPAAARALFYEFRGRGEPVAGVPGRNVGNHFQVIAQKGLYFVQVTNFTGRPRFGPDMAKLTELVWNALPHDEEVKLLGRLCQEGRVANAERIIRGPFGLQRLYTLGEGDVLQLGGKYFGVAADYEDGSGSTFTRVVACYDTPATATAAFRHVVANLDPYMEVLAQTKQELVIRDHEDRFGVITLKGDVCELRLGLSSRP